MNNSNMVPAFRKLWGYIRLKVKLPANTIYNYCLYENKCCDTLILKIQNGMHIYNSRYVMWVHEPGLQDEMVMKLKAIMLN